MFSLNILLLFTEQTFRGDSFITFQEQKKQLYFHICKKIISSYYIVEILVLKVYNHISYIIVLFIMKWKMELLFGTKKGIRPIISIWVENVSTAENKYLKFV